MHNFVEQPNSNLLSLWKPANGRVFEKNAYALDVETEEIDRERPQQIPRMIVAAVFDGKKACLLEVDTIVEFFRTHADLTVVMHNAAFDLAVIDQEIRNDFDVYSLVDEDRIRDTWILHRLYNLATTGNGEWSGSSLEESCQKHLGIKVEKDLTDASGDLVRTNFRQWKGRLADLPSEYREYLFNDITVTYQLYQEFQSLYAELGEKIVCDRPFGFVDREQLIYARKQHGALTHHIQLKAAIVLDAIKRNGLHVDLPRLAALRQELQAEQQGILENLRSLYGYPDKKVQEILDQEERTNGIEFPRTATGKISTAAESLAPFQERVPFVCLYLRHKKIENLLGNPLQKMQKGVLHPTFDVLKNTGRTSSSGDISSQNLPRDERVRALFVPSPGNVFIDTDYSGTTEPTGLYRGRRDDQAFDDRRHERDCAGYLYQC